MRFMQTESVLQSKNRSGPAKNRFSVALIQWACQLAKISEIGSEAESHINHRLIPQMGRPSH